MDVKFCTSTELTLEEKQKSFSPNLSLNTYQVLTTKCGINCFVNPWYNKLIMLWVEVGIRAASLSYLMVAPHSVNKGIQYFSTFLQYN